jgi:23S rRNA (uracil1939-C5)-methyltransferase
MTVQGKKIVDLEILDASYGGEGFARLEDGRPIFVPFVLPGEQVQVAITVESKDFCRGELLAVLRPSPKRIQPRCPHFGSCGGCHYQHIRYDHQLVLKQKIVIDQFKRIGKFAQIPVKDI